MHSYCNQPCPSPAPAPNVADIVAPVVNWAVNGIACCAQHYCDMACIASLLMGQGFDQNTALAMARDILQRQQMGMAGGPMGPGGMPMNGGPGMPMGGGPGMPMNGGPMNPGGMPGMG